MIGIIPEFFFLLTGIFYFFFQTRLPYINDTVTKQTNKQTKQNKQTNKQTNKTTKTLNENILIG